MLSLTGPSLLNIYIDINVFVCTCIHVLHTHTHAQSHKISKNIYAHDNNDYGQYFQDFTCNTFAMAGAVEGLDKAVHGGVPAL